MPAIVFRPITPRRAARIDVERVKAELGRALDDMKRRMIIDFRRGTATWETRVDFAARKYVRRDEIRINIFPTGPGKDVWKYVNYGTRAHAIRAKAPGKLLAFQTGYRAKTKPGRLSAAAGGASGQPAFARAVQHPGTKARRFDKLVARKHRPAFRRLVENGLRRALR